MLTVEQTARIPYKHMGCFPMIDYKKYITIDPHVRFGKPCIKGTRISVYDVLSWLANGMTTETIIADFPELSDDQIRACLAYAADKEHKLRAVA